MLKRFYDSKREKQYSSNDFEYHLNCKSKNLEWNENNPEDHKKDKQSDGQGPAHHKQDTQK